ncbi:MAG: dihydroorotase [Betaproteobacteria bacterium RIFCSPLOWO2_12_FULL_63_13]|nr:MAG: dihydroorotase [Betaproteobacteria bacterium RIFCSPLOWO2_12_FULL_63_13]
MNIHIKGCRLIDPKSGTDAREDLFLAAGVVAAWGRAPKRFRADRTIDAKGLVVCPGLVDMSVRLREPGYEYRATLESEMQAAVAGGVTSLACPPDTDPPLDEPALVEMLKSRAKSLNLARVYPLGALSAKLKGKRLAEMAELAEAGCVAFSQADVPIVDTEVLWRAMQYASTYGFPVWLRPQDSFLAQGGVAHDGDVATRLGLPAIPSVAETASLATMLQLARSAGARLHVCRLSTAEAVAMVRRAKQEGQEVTCDVAVHHVHLCEVDIGYFDSHCHLVPPLRSQRDRDALRAGLADGTIDAICSDHAPLDEDVKHMPFGESEPGATAVELLLSLTLKWATEAGVPLVSALGAVTSTPASIMRVDAGTIGVGATADLCVFDPEAHVRITPASLCSQGKNTPFVGYEVPGQICYTLVAGQVVYENAA